MGVWGLSPQKPDMHTICSGQTHFRDVFIYGVPSSSCTVCYPTLLLQKNFEFVQISRPTQAEVAPPWLRHCLIHHPSTNPTHDPKTASRNIQPFFHRSPTGLTDRWSSQQLCSNTRLCSINCRPVSTWLTQKLYIFIYLRSLQNANGTSRPPIIKNQFLNAIVDFRNKSVKTKTTRVYGRCVALILG